MATQSSGGRREVPALGRVLEKGPARFPGLVTRQIGIALGVVQRGGRPPSAKPWKGLGPGVLEIVEDDAAGTYRAVYTVRFAKAIYVLHAFQKKSPSGIRTARTDVRLIEERLKAGAQRLRGTPWRRSGLTIEAGSGNVFADLGFADAKELSLKVELAMEVQPAPAPARASPRQGAPRRSASCSRMYPTWCVTGWIACRSSRLMNFRHRARPRCRDLDRLRPRAAPARRFA